MRPSCPDPDLLLKMTVEVGDQIDAIGDRSIEPSPIEEADCVFLSSFRIKAMMNVF